MTLVLRTLGGLSLSGRGVPASSQQRRRLALLAVLARAGDHGMSRDELLALLWPEADERRARHALDQLVYATRRDLGRDVLQGTDGRLVLDGTRVDADCTAFEALHEAGALADAIDLYGGPFLAGFHLPDTHEFEEWSELQRFHFSRLYRSALERLAETAAAAGDLRSAASWWERRAAADPLDTRAAVAHAGALAALGNRAGALLALTTHERILLDELGVAPDSALVDPIRELATRSSPAPEPGAIAPAELPEPAGASAPGSAEPSAFPASPRDDRTRTRGARPPRRRWRWLAAAIAAMVALVAGAMLFSQSIAELRASSPGSDSDAVAVTPDTAAQRMYLQGRIAWDRRSDEALQEAVVLFRQATEADPRYAAAWGGLAQAYVLLGYHGYLPGPATYPKGRAAAERALQLDTTNAAAWAALGKVLQWERKWSDADAAFRTALRHAPQDPTTHQWYALLLTILGEYPAAAEHGRRAAELNPMSLQVSNTYGIMLLNAGAVDSAIAVYEQIVTNEPDTSWVRQNPWVFDNFSQAAAAGGQFHRAMALASRAAAGAPGHPRPLYNLARMRLDMGDTAAAWEAFGAADTLHAFHAVYRGMLHARAGDADSAFAWFGRVKEWGLPALMIVVKRPQLPILQQDPRYHRLLEDLRLVQHDPPP